MLKFFAFYCIILFYNGCSFKPDRTTDIYALLNLQLENEKDTVFLYDTFLCCGLSGLSLDVLKTSIDKIKFKNSEDSLFIHNIIKHNSTNKADIIDVEIDRITNKKVKFHSIHFLDSLKKEMKVTKPINQGKPNSKYNQEVPSIAFKIFFDNDRNTALLNLVIFEGKLYPVEKLILYKKKNTSWCFIQEYIVPIY